MGAGGQHSAAMPQVEQGHRRDEATLLRLAFGLICAQRILKVEYEFPPHVKVSKECRDLLAHILVPDPASRITIPEIQQHPWYLKDLPPGVAEMNDNLPVPTTGVQVGGPPVLAPISPLKPPPPPPPLHPQPITHACIA